MHSTLNINPYYGSNGGCLVLNGYLGINSACTIGYINPYYAHGPADGSYWSH